MLRKGTVSKPLRTELKHLPGASSQALERVPLRTQSVGCRATGVLAHTIPTDDSKPSATEPVSLVWKLWVVWKPPLLPEKPWKDKDDEHENAKLCLLGDNEMWESGGSCLG